MKMKKISNYLLCLFVSVIIACTSNNEQSIHNCKRVQVGMSEREVIEVMGEPDSKSKNKQIDKEKYFIYYYDMPALASTGIDIYFNSETQKVTKIFCGE